MDVPRTTRSTLIGLFGSVLLATGVCLPWLTQAGGTLEQIGPWEVAGFQPARAVLMVPLLAVVALRAAGRLARTERRRSATNDEQSSAVRAPARERQ